MKFQNTKIAAGFMRQSATGFVFAAGFMLLLLSSTASAQSQKAQPQKPPVEVPFEFVHNQIVVQVKIAGKGPFNMLVDTDTDPSAIDAATARELGLSIASTGAPASGAGTEANTTYPTTLPTVELGPITARQVAAATIDMSKISERMEKKIQGVLGFSFLKDRIIQIDYANSKLRFFAESPYPRIQLAPNTVNTIAMTFKREDGDVIIDSVFVNNEKMRATLDTGSSGGFSLTPEAVALLGLDDDPNDSGGGGKTETSVGYNGQYQRKTGILKSVRMGRYATEGVQAAFFPPKTGQDNKPYQVNIGNGFFQDFLMTFDFKNKIVVLERVD
jgi:predicted aspartyl protease